MYKVIINNIEFTLTGKELAKVRKTNQVTFVI